MNQKLLALYGLKWNPFTPEVPVEALHVSARLESFCWRIEHAQAREGGFALIHGEPGSGKSVALRVLAQRLARLPDVQLATISHPQCNLADFYRELGDVVAGGVIAQRVAQLLRHQAGVAGAASRWFRPGDSSSRLACSVARRVRMRLPSGISSSRAACR